MSEVAIGRNCENPLCGKPLFAKQLATAKRYCGSRCRTIAWVIKEIEPDGYKVVKEK